MADICIECGQTVEQLSPERVGELLKNHHSLYSWEGYVEGHREVVPGLGPVTVIQNSYNTVDEGEIRLIWETNHGYVAVSGYYDSYSGSEWNDDFKTAEKKTKEVVYFE